MTGALDGADAVVGARSESGSLSEEHPERQRPTSAVATRSIGFMSSLRSIGGWPPLAACAARQLSVSRVLPLFALMVAVGYLLRVAMHPLGQPGPRRGGSP